MKKQKNTIGLIWLIIILILGFICFMVYDKFFNNEIKENNKENTIKKEDKVLRRDNIIYKLNDKDYTISYVYKILGSKEFYEGQNIDKDNLIEYKNYIYNMVYLEILLNEKKLEIDKIPLYYDYENLENKEILNRIHILSSESINVLKGNNREYFVFTIEHANQYVDGGINPFIVNEEGKVLHTIEFIDNAVWWITNQDSIMYNKGKYYLNEDVLYYLKPNCEQKDGINLYFDQYSLKIENENVQIEKKGTYKGEAAGAAICE